MATVEQLTTALRNAHAAGDTAAAQKLAAALKTMRPGPDFSEAAPAAPPQTNPALQPALDAKVFEAGLDQPGGSYRGSILPLSRDANGNVSFDSNAGIVGSVKRAVSLPGEVYRGEVQMPTASNPGPETNYEFAPLGIGTGLNFSAPSPGSGMGRAVEMAGVVSPVNPAIRAGDRAIPGMMSARKPVKVQPPTAQELRAAGGRGFDAVREMGVDFSAPAVGKMATDLRASLEKDGILEELAPKAFRILAKLENPPEGGVAPLSGLEAARRAFGHVAKDVGPDRTPTADALAAKRIMGRLDEFVTARDPSSVVAGPAAAAATVLEDARANYAAGKRSDRITTTRDNAEGRAAATGSGANIDNSIRQRVESILQNPKQRAGFSKEEIELLKLTAHGTITRNGLRKLGNLLGGGLGLGAGVVGGVAGAAGGFPLGLAVPLAGVAAKQTGNALTRRALTKADLAVRRRNPLYRQRQADAGTYVPDPDLRASLAKTLLAIEANSAPQDNP